MFKDGKVFGRINVIDFIVILVIAALIVGATIKFSNFNKQDDENSDNIIEYTVLINNVRNYTLDAIQSGDLLYDTQSGVEIGTITNISSANAKTDETLYNGEVALIENPYKYDITLTVEVPGVIKNDAYYANKSVELKVNGTKNVETKYLKTSATIGDIKIK